MTTNWPEAAVPLGPRLPADEIQQLEVQPDPPLNLPRSTEGEHARTGSGSYRVASIAVRGSVDAAGVAHAAGRERCQRVRQATKLLPEVCQVEHVEGAERRL